MLTHRATQLAGSMRAAPRMLAGATRLAPGPSHLRQSAHKRLVSRAAEYNGNEQYAAGPNGAELEQQPYLEDRPFVQIVDELPRNTMLSLMGRLGTDVTVRTTPTGLKVASARMVINPSKREDGSVPQPVWYKLNWWAEKADEAVAQGFQKGEGLAVSGRLVVDTWTDRNTGKQRASYDVSVDYTARCQNIPRKADAEQASQQY